MHRIPPRSGPTPGTPGGRARPAVGDVVAHRVVEEERVLEHHADLAAQRTLLQRPQVHAVHADRARRRVVEPLQQRHHRALPRAARADQCDHLARADVQVDRLQHRLPLLIGEADAVELDLAPQLPHDLGVRRIAKRVLRVQDREDHVQRDRRLAQRLVHVRQPLDRTEQPADVAEERDQRPHRHLAPDHEPAAEGERREPCEERDQVPRRADPRVPPDAAHDHAVRLLHA